MMGELFQNNHHKSPNNVNFANKWFEFDPSYPIIKLMHFLRIIRLRKVWGLRSEVRGRRSEVRPPTSDFSSICIRLQTSDISSIWIRLPTSRVLKLGQFWRKNYIFLAVSLRGGTTKQSILALEIASLRSQGQALITCHGYFSSICIRLPTSDLRHQFDLHQTSDFRPPTSDPHKKSHPYPE